MLINAFKVDSPNVEYKEEYISSTYDYQHTDVVRTEGGEWVVKPQVTRYEFHTDIRVPKLG